MPFLKSLRVRPPRDRSTHPFTVPAVAGMIDERRVIRFARGVTCFVGDNGSGKSTLLEALAVHQGLNAEGGTRNMRFETRFDTVSTLHQHLRVDRRPPQPNEGFFLRAESYFNVATAIEEYDVDGRLTPQYGGSPHDRSHGESFIDLVVHRFQPRGLYLLDEPEAALSVHGQLQLLVRMHDLVRQGAQFVLATHSPLLTAYPGARIYSFDDGPPTEAAWSELDAVTVTADFLSDPAGFMNELLTDD